MRPIETENSHKNAFFQKKKKRNLETQMFAADVYPNAYSMCKKRKEKRTVTLSHIDLLLLLLLTQGVRPDLFLFCDFPILPFCFVHVCLLE